MRLSDLLAGETVAVQGSARAEDIEVSGLTADSRAVERGFLFATHPRAHAPRPNIIDPAITPRPTPLQAPVSPWSPTTIRAVRWP